MKADGSRIKPITHDPGFQEQPHWSPDGKRVAYVTHRGEIATKRPFLSARESLLSPTTPLSDVVASTGPRGHPNRQRGPVGQSIRVARRRGRELAPGPAAAHHPALRAG